MSLLRQLLGPGREEIWRQLCGEINAQYVPGGLWQGDKVVARLEPWTVTLDTYTVSTGKSSASYTRFRAPFVNRDGFRFTIYRRGLFSDLGKLLGMQDVEIGDEAFDQEFILQGTDEARLRGLLANPRIKDLIRQQRSVRLCVQDDEGWFGAEFPEGVDELQLTVPGIVKDVERLKQLYELFAELLHQLCHIGSAYQDDPGLSL
jgi:hypothetical protein